MAYQLCVKKSFLPEISNYLPIKLVWFLGFGFCTDILGSFRAFQLSLQVLLRFDKTKLSVSPCIISLTIWKVNEKGNKIVSSLRSTAQFSRPPWSPACPRRPASPSRPRCSSFWMESSTLETTPSTLTASWKKRRGSLIRVTSRWSMWRTLSSSPPVRRSWLNTTRESHWHWSSTWVTPLRQEVQISALLISQANIHFPSLPSCQTVVLLFYWLHVKHRFNSNSLLKCCGRVIYESGIWNLFQLLVGTIQLSPMWSNRWYKYLKRIDFKEETQ